MNKKIAIIGAVGLPAKYSGFETLVDHLVKQLNASCDFTVFCSSRYYEEKLPEYNGAKLVYLKLNANGVQSIFYDIFSIFKALKFADTLLILGVSGCVVLPFVKLLTRKNIIVNIDGLEWKRQKWGKLAKWFLKFSERLAVNYSDKIIADNKFIQEYVLAEYGKPSELIAYGADHVSSKGLSKETLKDYPFLRNDYGCTVCRVEPENNLHIILEAVVQQKGLPMVMVGNWNNSNYGRRLRAQYLDVEHLYLLDPIFDQDKLDQIRSNCTVYLHGHSVGGTNPSLVDAMYLALPVFAYDVNYNKETTGHKARYFKTSDELLVLISSMDKNSLDNISIAMHDIAKDRYTWKKIAKAYTAIF